LTSLCNVVVGNGSIADNVGGAYKLSDTMRILHQRQEELVVAIKESGVAYRVVVLHADQIGGGDHIKGTASGALHRNKWGSFWLPSILGGEKITGKGGEQEGEKKKKKMVRL